MDIKLVMFRPNGQRKEFIVENDVTVIGRGEGCNLRAPLENISRRHCEISVEGDEITVKDLASSNGTYVNNKRVNEAPLKAGDRLVLGPVVFTVQVDGEPEDIAPPKTRAEAAAERGEDEIVDLEADSSAPMDLDEADVFAAAGASEAIDPIAALEALAAEGQQDDDEI